jgi:hypothetical protein
VARPSSTLLTPFHFLHFLCYGFETTAQTEAADGLEAAPQQAFPIFFFFSFFWSISNELIKKLSTT